jgi:hypothetical protein
MAQKRVREHRSRSGLVDIFRPDFSQPGVSPIDALKVDAAVWKPVVVATTDSSNGHNSIAMSSLNGSTEDGFV